MFAFEIGVIDFENWKKFKSSFGFCRGKINKTLLPFIVKTNIGKRIVQTFFNNLLFPIGTKSKELL